MFNRFFSLFRTQPTFNYGNFPPEMWALIFMRMEPCFLFDIMCVSKEFMELVQSDAVAKFKLKQYAPRAFPQGEDTYFDCFGDHYVNRFSTLMSGTSRRLLSFILEGDWEQIKTLPLTPDMMDEEDGYETTIGRHINDQDNQALRDIVFATVHKHSETEQEYRANFNEILHGSKTRYLSDIKYRLAAALNQIEILQCYRPLRDIVKHDREHLLTSIRYGHFEASQYLIQHGKWICGGCDAYYPDCQEFTESDPLMQCARWNQVNIALLILDRRCSSLTLLDLMNAVCYAAHYGNTEILHPLLKELTARDGHQALPYDYPLRLACAQRHADTCTTLLAYFPEYLEEQYLSNPNKSVLFSAARPQTITILEYICSHAPNISHLLKNNIRIKQLFYSAVANGAIEVVRTFLDHGAIADDRAKEVAREADEAEILDMLNNPLKRKKSAETEEEKKEHPSQRPRH